ncbi:UBP-type zinc finger domain-containing protein [Amaricoccus sp.]|uniref:UBP-type zinc finger domain-containing protein n=1 Tax=Amaricoccus sp. TaxID=1872485 RepID=UPI00345DC7C6
MADDHPRDRPPARRPGHRHHRPPQGDPPLPERRRPLLTPAPGPGPDRRRASPTGPGPGPRLASHRRPAKAPPGRFPGRAPAPRASPTRDRGARPRTRPRRDGRARATSQRAAGATAEPARPRRGATARGRICGHVGCCDSSPSRHATAHFPAAGHPVIEGYDPPEGWGWRYVDAAFVDLPDQTPGTARSRASSEDIRGPEHSPYAKSSTWTIFTREQCRIRPAHSGRSAHRGRPAASGAGLQARLRTTSPR